MGYWHCFTGFMEAHGFGKEVEKAWSEFKREVDKYVKPKYEELEKDIEEDNWRKWCVYHD